MQAFILAVCCLISGQVRAESGQPLAQVAIGIRGPISAQTVSDAHGNFSLIEPPGSYFLSASLRGYAPVTIALQLQHDARIDIALEPVNSPSIRQIGTVTVDGRLAPIRGAVPSVNITRADLDLLGQNRIVNGLMPVPSVTLEHPNGGAASAVSTASLRGPDPSEALDLLDGQLLNDGNTGDLDLSRFPVAAFSSVDIAEGLGPQDAVGSNTFGGSINFVSLHPTIDTHYALSLSTGSFGSNDMWLNATGMQSRLGFAFALDDQNERGYVNQTVPLYVATPLGKAPSPPNLVGLGSSIAAHLALVNCKWMFSQNADLGARALILGDNRDQSSSQSGIDGNQGDSTFGHFIGPGAQVFAQTIRAYLVSGRLPFGAGELTSSFSLSDNGIGINGQTFTTPYNVNHQDRRYTGGLAWLRAFDTSQFGFGSYTEYESLGFVAPAGAGPPQPALGQTINVVYVRGGLTPAAKLHLDGSIFDSRYSSFGANLDGRFGTVYNADPQTSIRFSIGTGFRAPLLIERYLFPASQLTQDANGVFVGQGNRDERPEHATLYELGGSHEFAQRTTLDVSLYRTTLRNPIEIFYPLNATAPPPGPNCTNASNTPQHPFARCFSFTTNLGDAVYQGSEMRLVSQLSPQHVLLTAFYGINVAFPRNLNATVSNPTSGGSLVNDQQFLGIPQQQGSLQLDWKNAGWHASAASIFRGKNNELNEPPFTIVDALIGNRIGRHIDVSLAGSNLLNAAAGQFTIFGGGVPYRGVVGEGASLNPIYGSLPTNAYHIEPAAVRLILTLTS